MPFWKRLNEKKTLYILIGFGIVLSVMPPYNFESVFLAFMTGLLFEAIVSPEIIECLSRRRHEKN